MNKGILVAIAVLMSNVAFGHGDHAPRVAPCLSKECTKEQINSAVPTAIEMLVKAGKVEASWASAKIEKVEQKTFSKSPEWVATLNDSSQKDQAKQKLYIFITSKGYLSGANFTGK